MDSVVLELLEFSLYSFNFHRTPRDSESLEFTISPLIQRQVRKILEDLKKFHGQGYDFLIGRGLDLLLT